MPGINVKRLMPTTKRRAYSQPLPRALPLTIDQERAGRSGRTALLSTASASSFRPSASRRPASRAAASRLWWLSAGIFSIAFRDRDHGVIVGGDYRKPDDTTATVRYWYAQFYKRRGTAPEWEVWARHLRSNDTTYRRVWAWRTRYSA